MALKKVIKASEAITKAKKNSLARKKRVANGLMQMCAEKINEMIENGAVRIYVPMNEEQHYWGLPLVEPALVEAGYQVILEEDEKSDTPDLIISIEHLK
jgi:hypothetical protein